MNMKTQKLKGRNNMANERNNRAKMEGEVAKVTDRLADS